MSGMSPFDANASNEEVIEKLRMFSEDARKSEEHRNNPLAALYKMKITCSQTPVPMQTAMFALFEDVDVDVIARYEEWMPDFVRDDQKGFYQIRFTSNLNSLQAGGIIRWNALGQAKPGTPDKFVKWECFTSESWRGPAEVCIRQPRRPVTENVTPSFNTSPLGTRVDLSTPASPVFTASTPLAERERGVIDFQHRAELAAANQRNELALQQMRNENKMQMDILTAKLSQIQATPAPQPKPFDIEKMLAGITAFGTAVLMPIIGSQIADRKEAEAKRLAMEEKRMTLEQARIEADAKRMEAQFNSTLAIMKEKKSEENENQKLISSMITNSVSAMATMSQTLHQSQVNALTIEKAQMEMRAGPADGPLEKILDRAMPVLGKWLAAKELGDAARATNTFANPNAFAGQQQMQPQMQQQLPAPVTNGVPSPTAQPPVRQLSALETVEQHFIRVHAKYEDVYQYILAAVQAEDPSILGLAMKFNGDIDKALVSRMGKWRNEEPNKTYVDGLVKYLNMKMADSTGDANASPDAEGDAEPSPDPKPLPPEEAKQFMREAAHSLVADDKDALDEPTEEEAQQQRDNYAKATGASA